MSLRDIANNPAEHTRRRSSGLFDEKCDGLVVRPETFELPVDDPNALADLVIDSWRQASEAIILASAYLATALEALREKDEYLDRFLKRLVAGRVLSENDALARLKAHGKLSMLRKIGQHANTLLEPSILRLLPPSYSIVYQFCLLVEDVGVDHAKSELSPDVTREDLINRRADLKAGKSEGHPTSPPSLEVAGVQLFALQLSTRDLRLFTYDYVQADTLDRCLRRPDPAEDAGLVAIVPILMLGQFERTLLMLLGFRKVANLFLDSNVSQPEITDRHVIVVAQRGGLLPQALTSFSVIQDQRNVLALAERIFPNSSRKCQLFARERTEGWLTFVGDENWNEPPSW
jgi:hypothetical protein